MEVKFVDKMGSDLSVVNAARVSLETMIIVDELVEYGNKWDKQLKDDIVWIDLKKLMKNYKGFLTINKNRYRMKLLKLIEESN